MPENDSAPMLDLAVLGEVWTTYVGAALAGWQTSMWLGVAAAVALAMAWVLRGRTETLQRARLVDGVLFFSVIVLGMYLVIQRASLFDDAFISFRYARNLLEGHGLVWNHGERVEGYTNFLWTLLIAGLSWLALVEPAQVGLVASFACFPVNLWLVFRMERVLSEPLGLRLFVPWATGLVAVQDSFITAGTTGLLGEEVLLGAGELEPVGHVLRDVVCTGVVDGEAVVDAGEEGAVLLLSSWFSSSGRPISTSESRARLSHW